MLVVILELYEIVRKPQWNFDRLSYKARRELIVGNLIRFVNVLIIIYSIFFFTLFNRITRAVFNSRRILPRLRIILISLMKSLTTLEMPRILCGMISAFLSSR